ncbi:tetratricopeptide repeat protein [Roseimaritima ulvae]|uniref:Tetratricopeptide repeat protein n=1 Tax=Roseimaritima ulvae TaxID=980254 RepID=A0A5B9QLK7_9BACT|nr:tetratricopeptide repeat protein [Roseimaritima ulvae]QEG38692.1 Tetratricopeptide repeat protein [Roseimaritima ulvae]
MRSKAPIGLFIALFLGWIPVTGELRAQSRASDPQLRSGLALLAAGDYQQAHQTLQNLIDQSPPPATLTAALIANGKSLSKLQQHAAALKQYERALQQTPPESDSGMLQVIAADAAYRSGQTDQAMQWSSQVLAQSSDARQRLLATRIQIASQLSGGDAKAAWETLRSADAAFASKLTDLANQIGAAALTRPQPGIAEQTYQWLADHADSAALQRQAQLGIAWAAALGAQPPADAAARLRAFSERYPEDPDALRALRAEATCWRQAGNVDKVHEVLLTILQATAGRDDAASAAMAIAAAEELSAPNDRPAPPALTAARQRIVLDGTLGPNEPVACELGVQLLAAAMLDAAQGDNENYWQACVTQSLHHPHNGTIVAAALQRLSAAGQDAAAERLAATVLRQIESEAPPESVADNAPADNAPADNFPAACDAVCRWAAESGRWTMLALSAEHVATDQAIARLSPTSVRLLAEALMQTKRATAAQRWFDAAADAGATDFATLIRRAELAVALDDLETATAKWQTAADAVQQPEGSDGTLIEVLRAELAIRQARLEQARSILQRVVRLERTESQVRCRAQWLVGETFLLQHRFNEAVEAYRLVESFDTPAGNWTAVALVQAGKAFEQMGRPRDAAICYGGLLQRFADTEHALVARDRLAVIRNGNQRR